MSRRRSEWPEPWTRLKWAPGDVVRLERLTAKSAALQVRERQFVFEMNKTIDATLQQVAWLRRLARRYRLEEGQKVMPKLRRAYHDDE